MKKNKKKVVIIKLIIMIVILILVIITFLNSNIYFEMKTEKVALNEYNLYGESLNLKVEDSFSNEIMFLNKDTKEIDNSVTTKSLVDHGISPSDINIGTYYLEVDNKLLYSENEDVDLSYTTTPKEGKYYQISLKKTYRDVITLQKEKVKESSTCDIMIDVGHGGIDPGSISLDGEYESKFTLESSLMLKDSLQELGYNACINRTEDINPGNIEGVEYVGTGGRVYQFYEEQAKYGISIHFNTIGNGGYQIYSSVNTSTDFSEAVARKMQEISYFSELLTDEVVDNELGIIKKSIDEDEFTDYLFIIRETGGKAINTLTKDNEYKNSNYGTETLLLELGYLDNELDLKYIKDDAYMKNYIDKIAKGIDEYIQSK